MNYPEISIIIPIYNSMPYLEACIESVKSQTYKNIEIILVDDGSTDESYQYCDMVAKSDSRVLVIHKKNGGLSSARNAGIKIASGKYITFLDSDDYLSTDFVKKTLKLCQNNDAEIAILNMKYIVENEAEEINDEVNHKQLIFDSENAIKESLIQKRYTCSAPGKIYQKDLFKEIEFPEGNLSEDLAICHVVLDEANRIVYSYEYGYYYRQHAESIMHVFNERRMDALKWALEIEDFCLDRYPDLSHIAKARTFNVSVHLLLDLLKDQKEHRKIKNILWKQIKRTRKTTIISRDVRLVDKIAALLSYGGDGVLQSAWKSKFAIKKDQSN